MNQFDHLGYDGLHNLGYSSILQINIVRQVTTDLLQDGQEESVVLAFKESVQDRVDDEVWSQLGLCEVSGGDNDWLIQTLMK